MAPPVYVSSGWYGSHSGSPATKNLAVGTIAVGDLVCAHIQQISTLGTTPTYSVTDNLGNTYTRAVFQLGAGNRYLETWYAVATAAGSCTLSATQTPSQSVAWTYHYTHHTPASGTTIAFDAASSFSNTTSVTGPYCCAPGEINTSPDVAVIASWCNANNVGTVTDPSGFTLRSGPVLTKRGYLWTNETSSALIANRVQVTHTVAQQSIGVVTSFKSVSATAPTNFVSDWW